MDRGCFDAKNAQGVGTWGGCEGVLGECWGYTMGARAAVRCVIFIDER